MLGGPKQGGGRDGEREAEKKEPGAWLLGQCSSRVERRIHNPSVVSSSLTIAKGEARAESGPRAVEARRVEPSREEKRRPAPTQTGKAPASAERGSGRPPWRDAGRRRRGLGKRKRKRCKYDGINSKWGHEPDMDRKDPRWDR